MSGVSCVHLTQPKTFGPHDEGKTGPQNRGSVGRVREGWRGPGIGGRIQGGMAVSWREGGERIMEGGRVVGSCGGMSAEQRSNRGDEGVSFWLGVKMTKMLPAPFKVKK